MNSALPRISHPVISLARRSRRRGVLPIRSRIEGATCMAAYLRKRGRSSFDETELNNVRPLGAEARLAVAQVELPQLPEPLVEAQVGDLFPGGLEPPSPFGERLGVADAET